MRQVTVAYVALCKQTCLVPQSVAAVVAILGDLSDQVSALISEPLTFRHISHPPPLTLILMTSKAKASYKRVSILISHGG